MSDELTINVSMAYAKAGLVANAVEQILVDVAGGEHADHVQLIGTSNEPIDFVDAAPGYVLIINLDATNFVQLFGDDMNAELHDELLPGDLVIRRLDGSTPLYGKADTAPCRCLVLAIDL